MIEEPCDVPDLVSLQTAIWSLLDGTGIPHGSISNFRVAQPWNSKHPPCPMADLRLSEDVTVKIIACGFDDNHHITDHLDPVDLPQKMAAALLRRWNERDEFLLRMEIVRRVAAKEAERATARNAPITRVAVVPDLVQIYGEPSSDAVVLYDMLHANMLSERYVQRCSDEWDVTRAFRANQAYLIYLEQCRAEYEELGAHGEIDSVALAALSQAGLDPAAVIEKLLESRDVWIELDAPRLRLRWEAGIILCRLELLPGISWDGGSVCFAQGSEPHDKYSFFRFPIIDAVPSPLLRSDMIIKCTEVHSTYFAYRVDPPLALFSVLDGKVTWIGEPRVTGLY